MPLTTQHTDAAMQSWPLGDIRRRTIGERTAAAGGTDVTYRLYEWDDPASDPVGCYDRDGTIYVSQRAMAAGERFADLTALHELIERQQKAKGRSNAYAHRRAYVEELLASRALGGPEGAAEYVHWKVGLYPDWKMPDKAGVTVQLTKALAGTRPRKGELRRLITVNRL